MDKKRLPIGFSEFSEIITEDYYFVDKSLFIEELLNARNKVTLITRPRRFGKTLNMTMLREFFSIDVDSNAMFAGLKIMATKYACEINKYPVLFFSFKDVKGDTALAILRKIKAEILKAYLHYQYLCEKMSPFEKEDFSQIFLSLREQEQNNYYAIDTSIKFLSEIIHKYTQIRPILLIDEYDTPMISAYEKDCYEELRSFFTNLYSSALKDNPHLNFAVLTGIQRIAKENIFSGLNNLLVCTVLNKDYRDYFGLTVEETTEILQYYGSDLTEAISAMYNGYNFGGKRIFNPWSIINYAKRKELDYFWVNTSSNTLIRNLLREIDSNFSAIFDQLLETQKIYVPLNLSSTFFELRTVANFWGLLVNSGYLTLVENEAYDEDLSALRIPNGEVKREFRALVANYVGIEPSLTGAMFRYLLKGDTKNFAAAYQDILLTYPSFHDFKENSYHMLFLGMSFYLENSYTIKSNIETGHGRADIIYTAKRTGDPNLIIEFKHGKDIEKINELAKEALEQIKVQKYYAGLIGPTLLVGVAHYGKKVTVVTEMMENR